MEREYTAIEKEMIEKAKKKALSLLEYADRTEQQLIGKLQEKDFPDYAISEALAFVKSFHYIDDRRFAETYIAIRKNEKSPFELTHELKNKGVSEEMIHELLEALDMDPSQNVKNLFIKKYGRKNMEDPKLYEKAFRFFANKGYGFEAVKKGIREAIEALSADEE